MFGGDTEPFFRCGRDCLGMDAVDFWSIVDGRRCWFVRGVDVG